MLLCLFTKSSCNLFVFHLILKLIHVLGLIIEANFMDYLVVVFLVVVTNWGCNCKGGFSIGYGAEWMRQESITFGLLADLIDVGVALIGLP